MEQIADATSELVPFRDNAWLAGRLTEIRAVHFADVRNGYPIDIRFGTRARYRFGSISARNGRTLILINALFADPAVPVAVIDATIGHEMAHYTHGYGSGLPRLYAEPHRGGVVEKELARRGLAQVEHVSEEWRKANWEAFYESRCQDIETRKEARTDRAADKWSGILLKPGARTEEELRIQLHKTLKRIGARAGEPVFEVAWLHATPRQAGLSYWYHREKVLRLHGLLADRRVPDCVVEFELTYWAIRLRTSSSWEVIQRAMVAAGMGELASNALAWRRKSWTAFKKRNHPLR